MSFSAMLQESLGESPIEESFKVGQFWKSKRYDMWFFPMSVQKNGAYHGLQLDLSYSKKPKKKSLLKSEEPGGRNEFWVKADPPADILGYFKSHPDFPVVEEATKVAAIAQGVVKSQKATLMKDLDKAEKDVSDLMAKIMSGELPDTPETEQMVDDAIARLNKMMRQMTRVQAFLGEARERRNTVL